MSILRFKCHNETLYQNIQDFSDMYKYESHKDLKEHYKTWLNKHASLIEIEKNFLERNYYSGEDIHKKIFKSIKYYFIPKYLSEPPKKKKTERTYNIVPKPIIQIIRDHLKKEFENNKLFKPSETFETFKDTIEFDEHKLKKCYKNQYYQLKKKLYTIDE